MIERRRAADRAAALGEGEPATPLNTIGFARAEVADGPVWVEAPPYGYGRAGEAPDAVTVTETADAIVLENGRLRAELGRDGLLRSLVERATGREALAGPGNVMQLYDDRPTDLRRLGRRPVPPGDGARRAAGRRRARCSARARCAPRWRSSGRSARTARCARSSGWTPARRGWSSTARPTGASRTRCSRCCSRSPSTPPTRPTRCSSGTPSGRRTTRPATTWPATRCPATASPTCPSTASAWPC